MAQLSLALFGTFDARLDGRSITDFRSVKARALLAYLALEPQPHQRAYLAGLLWPEWPEASARTYLRQALNNLQQLLGDKKHPLPFLLATPTTLQFNPNSNHRLDVALFSNATARHLAGPAQPFTAPAVAAVQEAVTLYRGPLLPGFFVPDCAEYEQWLLVMRERLQRQALTALQRLADFYEQQGKLEQAQVYAQRWVELEPTAEEAHRQLMRLLAQSGQRNAALLQFEKCRALMAEEIGVELEAQTVALYEQIRAQAVTEHTQQSGPAPTIVKAILKGIARAPLLNLPAQPTHLVGREKELTEIAVRLNDPECRLLTLIGPGGIGKTRLAIEAATQAAPHYPHGVHFVPLAAVSAAHLIPAAIADALQLTFYAVADLKTELWNYVRAKQMLLVLDNFEHLLAGVELVLELLTIAPAIKLLVTSRERIKVRHEWLLPIGELPMPDDAVVAQCQQTGNLAQVNAYPAIQLFLNCARRLRGDCTLEALGPAAAARLCRVVAGTPLGIELAAGWLQVMACDQIAEEIQKNLDFLTTELQDVPARHRSLKAVFEHSWQLLAPAEQQVLLRLAVFRGGFRREAAQAVAAAPLHLLLALIDKAFLQMDADGRYQIHELLRQFALGKLAETAAHYVEVHNRHSDYYLRFLHEKIDFGKKPATKASMDEVTAEFDNLYAAWRWAIEQQRVHAIAQVEFSFWHYSEWRGRHRELYDLMLNTATLLRSLHTASVAQGDTVTVSSLSLSLSRILISLGWIDLRTRGRSQVEQCAQEAIALVGEERADSLAERAWAFLLLGWAFYRQGRQQQAHAMGQKSFDIFCQRDSLWDKGHACLLLGSISYASGDYTQAAYWFEQNVAAWHTTGIYAAEAIGLHALVRVTQAQGDYARAEKLAQECYQIQKALNYSLGIAYTLSTLGSIMRAQEDYAQAQHYYAAGLEMADEMGLRVVREACQYGLGWTCYACRDYNQARAYFEYNLRLAKEHGDVMTRGVAATLNGLATVACAQGQYGEASEHFQQALQIAHQNAMLPLMLDILVGQAQLCAAQGAPEEAVERLSLVCHHPAAKYATQQKARRLLCGLESALPSMVFAAVQERGKRRKIEEVIKEETLRPVGLR